MATLSRRSTITIHFDHEGEVYREMEKLQIYLARSPSQSHTLVANNLSNIHAESSKLSPVNWRMLRGWRELLRDIYRVANDHQCHSWGSFFVLVCIFSYNGMNTPRLSK